MANDIFIGFQGGTGQLKRVRNRLGTDETSTTPITPAELAAIREVFQLQVDPTPEGGSGSPLVAGPGGTPLAAPMGRQYWDSLNKIMWVMDTDGWRPLYS